MKYLRTFILVLLSVLLPVRGAVAAAMLCPGEASSIGTVAAVDAEQHGMQQPGTHDHSHGAASDEPSSGGHATACQFCAGGCCVTPLAFAPPTVKGPCLSTSAAFPALAARVTAFYPDGQDRPPRTI